MYMKITTLTIIVVLTAMILVTAGAFNSPALAKPSSTKSSKDTGTSSKDTGTSSKDTGTSSSGTTSTGTSSTVSKQLKSLISCLTSTSKSTGTLPTSSQYKTCRAQSSAGTVGGDGDGSTVGGGKTGGGLVSSTSGALGTGSLGSAGKAKTGSSSSTSP
jgi:hypothetical protein